MADFSFITRPVQSRAYYEQKLRELTKNPVKCEHQGGKGCHVCDAARAQVVQELHGMIKGTQVA
jgi:hypothetical protein